MLNWWLGRPVEGKYLKGMFMMGNVIKDLLIVLADHNPEPEVPETPAPVFAARALKSALFGTPAPTDETIYENNDTEEGNTVTTPKAAKLQPRNLSPTKPPGILLTPGTATTRRKTVSFDHEVVEKGEKVGTFKAESKKSARASSSAQIPTPWILDTDSSVTRKTTLTRTLENAREGKPSRSVSGTSSTVSENENTPSSVPIKASKDGPSSESDIKKPLLPKPSTQASSRPKRANRESSGDAIQLAQFNSDATMDLNEPHSQSGKYWKSEYEQYHAAAKAQMERLINYKVLAKSFAKMKDDEAIAMTQKLEEEQRKVIQMETKVTQLSEKISNSSPDGSDSSTEMVKDLARQTALAMQYRSEVEAFRAAMEDSCRDETLSVQRRISNSTRPDGASSSDSRRTREQLKEADTLRKEVKQLRQSLLAAEEKNTELQTENAKLTQDLLHADLRHTNHLEKCDERRDSFDGQLQRKEERYRSLQKDFDKFKDIAKKSRRDAEILLKKRYDQTVELRKEIASLRGAESTAQELKQVLQKQSLAHEEVVTHFQKKHEEADEMDQTSEDLKSRDDEKSLAMSPQRKDPNTNATPFKRDSQIPVLTSILRPSRTLAPTKSMRSEPASALRPQSSMRTLSEIVNGASVDTVPPQGAGPVKGTPTPIRIAPLDFSSTSSSPRSPEMHLPSPEPSVLHYGSNRAIHERNCHASPRPSMFNLTSSPPKAAVVRSRPNELTKQRSSNNLGALPVPSTVADTSRVRKEMAPDRLAAAKARLEQKKRTKEADMQKENIRA